MKTSENPFWLEVCTNTLQTYEGSNPGASWMVIKDGVVEYESTTGLANIETQYPITPETTFRLASVTKQFVAALILSLVQEGEISLQDTIPVFFPDFPEYGKDITIHHLLTHSSGLLDYEDLFAPNRSMPILDEEVLSIMEEQTRGHFIPGTAYRYSNTGFCILHLILEQMTGEPLEVLLDERIFKPLGMNDAFIHEAGMPDTEGMAYGHMKIDGSYQIHNQDMTSWTIGDGGAYASIRDMAAWSKTLLEPHMLGDIDLLPMFTPHIATDESERFYGYGLVIRDTSVGQVVSHEGESVGFRNCIYAIPEKGVCVVFLSNREDGDPYEVCQRIMNAFLAKD